MNTKPSLIIEPTKASSCVLGMIQSNYIPWRGYFDFINSSDIFVIYDDVQYTSKDWRNRNVIKTVSGTPWLTVPVSHSLKSPQLIQDTFILYHQNWVRKHLGTVKTAYLKAPYYKKFASDYFDILTSKHDTISSLNFALIRWVLDLLDIKTPIIFSKDLNPVGFRTDRIIDIATKVGATSYLVGKSAQSYIEVDKFKAAGIGLEYKTYSYLEYPQLHGPFEPNLSILDLVFNCGTESRKYLENLIPNKEALKI